MPRNKRSRVDFSTLELGHHRRGKPSSSDAPPDAALPDAALACVAKFVGPVEARCIEVAQAVGRLPHFTCAIHLVESDWESDQGDLATEAVRAGLPVTEICVHGQFKDRFCEHVVKVLIKDSPVRVLRFNGTGMARHTVETCRAVLQANSSLRELHFRGNHRLDDALCGQIVSGLQQHPKLEVLDLSYSGVAAHTIQALAKSFKNNRNLRVLDLSMNEWIGNGDHAAMLLVSMLNHCNLETVRLGECGLGMAFTSHVTSTLTSHQTIRCLDLHNNHALLSHKECGPIFANLLRSNEVLVELDLCACGMTSKVASALGDALQHNSTLRKLFVANNMTVGDAGGRAIARGLTINMALQELDVSYCALDGNTTKALVKMLNSNRTLRRLHVQGLTCLRSGAKELRAMWRKTGRASCDLIPFGYS